MTSPTIDWTEPPAAHSDVGGAGNPVPRASRAFPGQPTSVGRARHFLRQVLPEDCGGEVAWTSALMLSELATNAVQHAATAFDVAVELIEGGRAVRVSVTDTAEGFPTPETAAAHAPRGRGLKIVDTLADAWGVDLRRDPPGKTVWFTAALPEPPAPPSKTPAVQL
jgi:anti-sigma regulatory factor (Ser/Thr protein kinase)